MWQTEIFVILGCFLPFQPPDNVENQNFKIEKKIWRYYHFTICTTNDNHVMHDSWDKERDRHNLSFWTVFCLFTSLWTQKINILKKWKQTWRYYHFTNVYHKWQSYNVSLLIWSGTENYFCHFGSFFALLPPKDQDFEKMKKTSGDIIILRRFTINDNHMMYSFWDHEHDRQTFLWFWTIFCPFTPLKTWKIRILKKMKKTLEI